MILVLDLDETMVYSRREVLPPHDNYMLVEVISLLSRSRREEKQCWSRLGHTWSSSCRRSRKSSPCGCTQQAQRNTRTPCWTRSLAVSWYKKDSTGRTAPWFGVTWWRSWGKYARNRNLATKRFWCWWTTIKNRYLSTTLSPFWCHHSKETKLMKSYSQF